MVCDYSKRPGEIMITRIDPKKGEDAFVHVRYSFKSTVPNALDNELASTARTLVVNKSFKVSKEWCKKKGVKVGAHFPATRLEIIKGNKTEYCDQVTFDIPLEKE